MFENAFAAYKQYLQKRSEENRNKFYSLFRTALIAYARYFIPPSQGARTWCATDLVNDTFFKIDAESLLGREFNSAEDLRKYALTLIKHRYIDYCRKRKPRLDHAHPDPLETIQAEDPRSKQELLATDLMLHVAAAIEALRQMNPRDADMVEHYFYIGHDHKEIAAIFGVVERTSRNALAKVRTRLIQMGITPPESPKQKKPSSDGTEPRS